MQLGLQLLPLSALGVELGVLEQRPAAQPGDERVQPVQALEQVELLGTGHLTSCDLKLSVVQDSYRSNRSRCGSGKLGRGRCSSLPGRGCEAPGMELTLDEQLQGGRALGRASPTAGQAVEVDTGLRLVVQTLQKSGR